MKSPALVAALTLGLLAPPLWAGPENVADPGNYRTSFTQYFSGDRTANDKQVIRIFANETAIAGKQKDGKLPYGSVVVGELYSVKLGADGTAKVSDLGQRIPDQLAAIVVMERGKGFDQGYPDALTTGDWEFAVFSPAGERLDKDITACRTCHHPLSDKEFLFSYQHLGQ
ncbi:cytochrome P460 family protein [Motiliproteus sediminis]|uniref:cytochrome P460 family protein n=1 Tax=Motiliproteus sediminis TaxID=1468178 RepID=UPI001AEFED84|nr:cytochrome P460 family protein [Motiliproteus sediminis]